MERQRNGRPTDGSAKIASILFFFEAPRKPIIYRHMHSYLPEHNMRRPILQSTSTKTVCGKRIRRGRIIVSTKMSLHDSTTVKWYGEHRDHLVEGLGARTRKTSSLLVC